MIEELINARLRTLATNVYPNATPTKYATPCVVYQVLEKEGFNDFDGYSTESFVTFMFAISSPIYKEAKLLARDILRDFQKWNDDQVQAVSWIDETSAVDNTTPVTIHRVMLFFKFFTAE